MYFNADSTLRRFPPSDAFSTAALVQPADFAALNAEAARDNVGYWGRLAREELRWHVPFTHILDDSTAPNYRWFTDGQLNASWNCLDVHLATRGQHPALVFEAENGAVRSLTYRQLHAERQIWSDGAK